jgi:hypothetical protein
VCVCVCVCVCERVCVLVYSKFCAIKLGGGDEMGIEAQSSLASFSAAKTPCTSEGVFARLR